MRGKEQEVANIRRKSDTIVFIFQTISKTKFKLIY